MHHLLQMGYDVAVNLQAVAAFVLKINPPSRVDMLTRRAHQSAGGL
jgi:hypothetical protein